MCVCIYIYMYKCQQAYMITSNHPYPHLTCCAPLPSSRMTRPGSGKMSGFHEDKGCHSMPFLSAVHR